MNRKSVLASSSRQKLGKFCAKLDLPAPVHKEPYNRHLRMIEKAVVQEAEGKMIDAANRLKAIIQKEQPENITIEDGKEIGEVAVSVDGSWQKRGYTSKIGVVFVLSVRTGEVLDYEVLSHYCHACIAHDSMDKESVEYKDWLAKHAVDCQVNHKGSSGDMENKGAIAMFKRSIAKRSLKYTTFVGDGDSSCFGNVSEAVKVAHGDSYQITKEECVGHIQKRMGTALDAYKKSMRGKKLNDGKGVGGAGRLTQDVIKRIQNYYGFAIRQNKGDLDGMVKAITAIQHHVIQEPSKSLSFQHRFCPKGKDSWCNFRREAATSDKEHHESNRLPQVFLSALAPIFKRLSNSELLSRCLLGLTQNQNESLNGRLWNLIPKSSFCGKRRVVIAVCETISISNTGAASKATVAEILGVEVGENMLRALRNEDITRLKNAARKISIKYRNRRKILKFARNKKKAKVVSYKAGSFGTGVTPDVAAAVIKKKKIVKRKKKEIVKKTRKAPKFVTFVNEDIDIMQVSFYQKP